ncbi:MAG: hypothetical protein ACREVS_02950, partial [Burkholderiales bacterium]
VDLVQRRVRAATKQASRVARSGQAELFSVGEFPEAEEPPVEISDVEEFWLGRLSDEPTRFREADFANMLEETDWFPGDLQRALGNLIAAGRVRNLDAPKKRRTKFLHYEKDGERLQLVNRR